MKRIFTLSTLVALTAASLSARAQFTVDGTLSTAEVGTGTGKYQLVGTYTGTHSIADRGLKALYMGTTATTLNVFVVASPEIANPGYNALGIYLDMPNATGAAAGTRLAGGTDATSQLYSRPTLDMPVDYAFRVTLSPLNNGTGDGNSYYSILDYTAAASTSTDPAVAGRYPDTYLGPTNKNGSPLGSNGLPNSQFSFQTTPTGSVAANTASGWEFAVPLSALKGAVAGNNINVMVAYLNNDGTFTSDILPQITSQTAGLGADPNFTTIAGKQYYTYQVGTGVLASRTAGSTLAASAYPNPVAAESRLAYTVADAAQPVTVTAYNSLGQPALTLLDGATQPAGDHLLALAPLQRLAAGVYLLQVRAGNQLSTQRVVVP